MVLVPNNWFIGRFGDIAYSVKGKKPKSLLSEKTSKSLPYIDIKAFERKVFESYTEDKSCPACKPDDVLLVWDGARCGLVGTGACGIIGSTLAKIETFVSDKRYLYFYLLSKYHSINKQAKGVGIPHVNPNILWELFFPLPPLPEQHRIVAKIEELFSDLDAGIASLRKAKEQLKTYRQSVLKWAFEGKLTEELRKTSEPQIDADSGIPQIKKNEKSDTKNQRNHLISDISSSDNLPEGWKWVKIGDLLTDLKYGTAKKCSVEEVGQPVLRIPNIGEGAIDQTNLKYADFTKEEIKQYGLLENDILVIRSNGSISLVGKAAIVSKKDVGFLYAGYLIRLRLKKDLCLAKFVCIGLSTPKIRLQIEDLARSTSGVNNINSDEIRSLEILLPYLEEQSAIVSEIESRLSVADNLEKTIDASLAKADALRQSILKRAFEGKLVPQDPNDEPAEKLLERIKAIKNG